MNRYTRQIRLADVGEAGQARLAAARVCPSGAGFAGAIEARYLRTAGVVIDDGGERFEADASVLGLSDPSAQAVGEGAFRALAAMRAVLAR